MHNSLNCSNLLIFYLTKGAFEGIPRLSIDCQFPVEDHMVKIIPEVSHRKLI